MNYAALTSFEIEASIVMVEDREDFEEAVASPLNEFLFSGAGAGEKVVHRGYRDPTHMMGEWDREAAWNGSRNQYLIKEKGTRQFSYTSENSAALSSSTENPLFLPLAFLSRQGDAEPGWNWRLQDAKNEAFWTPAYELARGMEDFSGAARFPGQPLQGRNTRYTVEFGTDPGFLPAAIQQEFDDGTPIRKLTFEYNAYPTDARTLFLPAVVNTEYYLDEPLRFGDDAYRRMAIRITRLDINGNLPDSLFDLNSADADLIWDGDIKGYVQSIGGASTTTIESLAQEIESLAAEGDSETAAASRADPPPESASDAPDRPETGSSWNRLAWAGIAAVLMLILALSAWRILSRDNRARSL